MRFIDGSAYFEASDFFAVKTGYYLRTYSKRWGSKALRILVGIAAKLGCAAVFFAALAYFF